MDKKFAKKEDWFTKNIWWIFTSAPVTGVLLGSIAMFASVGTVGKNGTVFTLADATWGVLGFVAYIGGAFAVVFAKAYALGMFKKPTNKK